MKKIRKDLKVWKSKFKPLKRIIKKKKIKKVKIIYKY